MVLSAVFIAGTFISYISLFLVPSKIFFPLPFFLFLFFSYKYLGSLKKALFISAVFALPYSWGKSLLTLDESALFVITPFAGFVALLSLLTIKEKITWKFSWPDVFLLLFFLWGIISFFFANTYPEVLDGIFKVALSLLFYFLTRIYWQDSQVRKAAIFIFVSIVAFESILAVMQFMVGHPLGRFIEEGLNPYPYGKLASEGVTLYRPSGTMSAPTWLSRFVNMLLPFVLLNIPSIIKLSNRWRLIIISFGVFAVFISFTRVSWAVLFLMLLYLLFRERSKIMYIIRNKSYYIWITVLSVFVILFMSFPYFYQRWQTTPLSFEEKGSFDLRIKLFSEAINVIEQYPVFGVGLNRYVTVASLENITGVYSYSKEQVHNLLMLIACETGIPGAIFFIGFIAFSYSYYFTQKKLIRDFNLRTFKTAAALGGAVYLAETMLNITFLAPHYYLFHLFMAILVL